MMEPRKQPVSPETALASEVFDQFCSASTLKTVLGHHRHLCELLRIKPSPFPQFYPKLKAKLRSWKAQALWTKFDKRASHKCYNRGKACPNTRVLIIGAGPCGLRTAIEAQLLGAKVVVVEKRDRFSRNNVLHLWPFVIHDLRALGAKKFFGKFCAGSIDHISIRALQCILLKVALILGVEIHEGVGFEGLVPPPADQTAEKIGWRAQTSPLDHPVSQYEFDVLIGADGKRNTLEGFKRKEFRGKLAIAITANFINRHTEAEARVEEISGVAFIFNQKFFKDLYAETGIDLENIVYYKDETHYFVMTAKKHSLIDKGVILQDYADTAKLLAPENVDKDALQTYAREAADFSTNYMLPQPEFAVNHYGQPDVAMFDFTSMFAAENASRVVERQGYRLLQILVGDSLLEPFWPTGSGCARGFLSSMDACWAIKGWGGGQITPLEVLAERESIYRILGQTTPENLHRDYNGYTLDPHTRYPNLNSRCVMAFQVRSLYDTDDPAGVEQPLPQPNISPHDAPKKRRRKDSQVHPDTLLTWLKKQVALYDNIYVENMTESFKNGLVLCAIIHRYRPDLLDFHSLKPEDVAKNNQLAFDTLERELGIPPVMTGLEMEQCDVPDKLSMLSYLSQVYDAFRGEIPQLKYPKLELEKKEEQPPPSRTARLRQLNTDQKVNLLGKIVTGVHHPHHPPRKRPSGDRDGVGRSVSPGERKADSLKRRPNKRRSMERDKLHTLNEDRKKIQEELEHFRMERILRRQYLRKLQTQQFYKSMQMLSSNAKPDDSGPFEDYSLFVYRQTAPDFKDRVKELERKIFYPDHKPQELAGRPGEADENFSNLIQTIEIKLQGSKPFEKKPKDLNRAIGKIEKSDWNVKELEKKIQQNKMGHSTSKKDRESVPKWNRQQFDDKMDVNCDALQFRAVESKLHPKKAAGSEQLASKFAEIDKSLQTLGKKLKEGSALDAGPRGNNKVSAMAEQFAVKTNETEPPPLQKSNSRAALVLPAQGGSESCHFCGKRVYLMERLSAVGKFFHRGCFRCEYCGTALRLNNYQFDREGKYGSRFFCMQHFGMQGKPRAVRKGEENRSGRDKENIPAKKTPVKTPEKTKVLSGSPDKLDTGLVPRNTPERIEFENLAGAASDVEEAPSEMDEDEWTDRNFGASAAEGSSDSLSDMSSDSEEEEGANEVFEEAMDQPLTADETRRLAETWTRRYSKATPKGSTAQNGETGKQAKECKPRPGAAGDEEEEDSDSLYGESDEELSYHEYESDDDESETATEGEADEEARELRRQEVRLEVPPPRPRRDSDTATGSDTEVASDSASESESEEVENSATEIETDSEFEHDGTTPTQHNIPSILVDDPSVLYRRGMPEEPKKVQVRTGHINGTVRPQQAAQNSRPGVRLEFSPLRPEVDSGKSASLSNLTSGNNIINANNKNAASCKPVEATPVPLVNPRRGDYFLNRTHSTEGIASKMSLELKKKYLLGASVLGGSVKKSGSASTLDSKVKSIVDVISEHQKLLNPAPEPSATMQAFLQGTSNLRASSGNPLSPPSPTILTPSLKLPPSPSQQSALVLRKQKELPRIGDNFEHICGKKEEMVKSLDGSGDVPSAVANGDGHEALEGSETAQGKQRTVPTMQPVAEVSESSSKIEELPASHHEEEADCRPRSPAHETSIVVPDIPWKSAQKRDDDIESDSLSSDDSMSELDEDDESEDHRSRSPSPVAVHERTPPRVEIRNSSGELMDEGGEIVETVEQVSENKDGDSHADVVKQEKHEVVDISTPKVVKQEKYEVVDICTPVVSAPEVVDISQSPVPEIKTEVISKLSDSSPEKMEAPEVVDLCSPTPPDVVMSTPHEIIGVTVEVSTTDNIVSQQVEVSTHPEVVMDDLRKSVEPLILDKRASLTSDRSSPSTPPSTRGDESEYLHNEGTLAAFTETELSDWAQDGVVSEDLEDVEFNINPEFVTVRKHRKTKTNRNSARGVGPSMFARIARGEDFGEFDDDPGHVCGKDRDSQDRSLEKSSKDILHSNMDNIEFMDTGEEEEDSDTDDLFDATNRVLLKNSGYVQFVDNDDDILTPVAEPRHILSPAVPTFIVSECEETAGDNNGSSETVEAVNRELIVVSAGEEEESSLQPEGTTTEETTTTSELATVKGSQDKLVEETEVFYTPKEEAADITPDVVPVKDTDSKAYEDYVRHLQGRISPFSNVRDSIDIRKSRRKNDKVVQHQELITEEASEDSGNKSVSPAASPLGFNSPSTSRKLEEISRERSKQKDLIHDMVLGKLSNQRKLSQERRQRRNNRVPLSPTSSGPSSPFDSQVLAQSSPTKEVPALPKDVVTLEMPSVALPVVEPGDALSERCSSVHQDLEVPFADDSVLVTEETEQFFTPLTSFKKQTEKCRPLSMHSSFRTAQRPLKYHALPDTPLTNPEAFSLPDIRKALFKTPDKPLKTPVAPPRTKHEEAKRTAERARVHEEARRRAKLKTDEELGLSPEDYIVALKEKASARRPGLERATSDPSETVKVLEPSEVLKHLETQPASTTSSGSPPSTPYSKATFYVGHNAGTSPSLSPPEEGATTKDRKKSKDPERRKSIIQAVSDFFHKKKESSASPSPPKTPNTSSSGKDKFRFKFTKSKDKGKSAYSSCSEDSDDKPDTGRSKSETRPPPIPPLPVNYPLSGSSSARGSTRHLPRASDSLSEPDEDSRATAVSTPTLDAGSSVGSLNRRQSRMHRRMARQAQLKRLRMAQEIQRQLEEVEVKQRELERRGVSVEKALRGEGTDVAAAGQEDEAELLREWFELVRERSELRRYEHELLVRAEELELEDRHARLQQELRDRLARDDSAKTNEDVAKEGQILGEMLEIVERRDSLIALLEEDRQRYQEEDRDFEAQMLAKGLRLTPLRKESHV
ncbi:uncharacterized protein Mical isoform X2 [Anabrus simplex]|uniref:uncharacterized protein Mical isoform X2 n=1 Tax=Anabrus simplex TaxID=316456 RepID=UPI0035A2B0DA